MRQSKIFTGSSHPELTNSIVEKLGVKPATISFKTFSNHETQVEIGESVRNMDVFIIQSGSETVNDHLMELLIMVNACKSASARRITAILPYFPYGKQCKKKKMRGGITAKLVANMLGVAGVNHVITMDLHNSQIQGFFNKPVDNLFAEPSISKYIREKIPEYTNGVVVSKNAAGAKRVTSLADRLKIDFALLHNDTSAETRPDVMFPAQTFLTLPRSYNTHHSLSSVLSEESSLAHDNVTSSPSVSHSQTISHTGQLTLVGDVNGKIAFIVDDMIDSAQSFIQRAKYLCSECKAKKVYIIGTHGIFSGDSLLEFQHCKYVSGIVVTNTYPIPEDKKFECPKLTVIDVSNVFAEAIRRTHNGESISYLFDATV